VLPFRGDSRSPLEIAQNRRLRLDVGVAAAGIRIFPDDERLREILAPAVSSPCYAPVARGSPSVTARFGSGRVPSGPSPTSGA